MKETDIAIIGMSCIFPGAAGLAAFWENIRDKKDAIQTVPAGRLDASRFDGSAAGVDRFYCGRGGFIPDVVFDPVRFGILPLAVEGMEPDQLLTLDLACKALEDAGALGDKAVLEQTGIIIGKGNYAGPGATRAIEIVRTGEQIAEVLRHVLPSLPEATIGKIKKEYQERKGRFSADTAMGLIPNLAASLVANRLNLGGAAYTVDAACASSLLAVDQAVREIHNGRCAMMIAGGVHVAQNAAFWSIFNQLGALSHTQQIRPFDQQADGLLIGEGCGFVVLKKMSEAIKDGNRIYAVIKGVGVSSDGSGTSVMSPAVKGQVKAIRQAWAKAGIDPAEVGYIEAHGTGTPLGDKTELETLRSVFGHDPARPRAGVGTVKSNIGHAMPAAGIAGLIKTALALYHDVLPPTLHCAQPLPQMAATRFRVVTEPCSWSGSGLKPYAGVNAFGFGGINAHVVLEGYGKRQRPAAGPFSGDEVLLLARHSKTLLIKALTDGDTRAGEGNYRIALFDPSPERVGKAIKIVSKDKPWRNRQDIWFTNAPLLSGGGKLAFVFPGLDGLAGGEVESVAVHFGLDRDPVTQENGLLGQALGVLEKSRVLDTAMKRLGIVPDMNAGHSLGEWLAARSSELAEEASVTRLLKVLDPTAFELKDSRFIAVGCGLETALPFMEQIPDLYLSNDNCPSQVILCGTYAAIDRLAAVLKERQIFYQVLPFQSGFHSPFVAGKLDVLLQGMENMRFQQTKIPLWSATTLQTYPENFDAIRALSVEHLIRPVRFRELMLKLYEEGARVFVQVGAGGLTGFIDDTLKGRMYSAVASSVPVRSGMAQLQRVLAALFTEGRAADPRLMGISGGPGHSRARGIKLQLGLPLVREWPQLDAIALDTGCSMAAEALPAEAPAHPVMRAMKENVDEMIRMQETLMSLFRATGGSYSTAPVTTALPVIQPAALPAAFTHSLNITLENTPYLIDHALLRQPPGWDCVQDMDPVIPMTMIFELFGDITAAQAPGRRVHKIRNTKVHQWMNVAQPFRETVKGHWKEPDLVQLDLEKYAAAEVMLAAALPVAPKTDDDIGRDLEIRITPEKIYAEHMFHGPAYQGILAVAQIGERGIKGRIKGAGGKGSLLDNAGQLFGLWLQLTLTKDRIAFPVKIQEIAFYGNMEDQEGIFDCTCVLTAMNDEFATANIVMKREGATWAIITGWQNRRLEIDEALWKVSMSPLHHLLSAELAPGVFLFHQAYNRVVSWDFILKRYFNQEEKKYYGELSPARKKIWMISRVAVKDAVRALLQRERGCSCFPITFSTRSNEKQQPYVVGNGMEDIAVSLAHKGTDAVAVAASGRPVGIDIETIAVRSPDFMDLACTAAERALIKDMDAAEWSTRLWVAKEAYGKMLGQGLKGNPRAYEVKQIRGDELLINDTVIKTMQHKNYIIGWTL